MARAFANDWSIICGDAVGVDQAVAEAVRDFAPVPEIAHFERFTDPLWEVWLRVYGLDEQPRHGVVGGKVAYTQMRYMQVWRESGSGRRKYLHGHQVPVKKYEQRDQVLIQEADCVLVIWNGRSRGSQNVAAMARAAGKECWLRTP